jgi:hypothetical protein
MCTPSVRNTKNTFQILSCTLFFPRNSLKSLGAWHLQGVESVQQWCWPMLTPMLPTVDRIRVGWMSFGWWCIHWYTRETDKRENPSSVAVLDTTCCAWHVLPYPVQRHLNILSYPLNGTHTTYVSRLQNHSLTCFLPFIHIEWSGCNKWHRGS